MLIKLINIKSVPKIDCSKLVYSFLQQEQFAETKSSSLTSNSAFVIPWQESHNDSMYLFSSESTFRTYAPLRYLCSNFLPHFLQ